MDSETLLKLNFPAQMEFLNEERVCVQCKQVYKEINNFERKCHWHPRPLDINTETIYLCCRRDIGDLRKGCTLSFHRRKGIKAYELHDKEPFPLLLCDITHFDKAFILKTQKNDPNPINHYIEFVRLK